MTGLLQVLANLISNAFKFTRRGAKISVRGAREGDQLRFSVQDTGTGIPPEDARGGLQAVLAGGEERPARPRAGPVHLCAASSTPTRGRIWAESTPNAGSTFHLTIGIGPRP